MILATERLRLRKINEADGPFILQLLNEPSFIANIGDRQVRTVAEAEKYISEKFVPSYEKNGFGLYLVELKEAGVPAGICGLVKRDTLPHVDIGFAFVPAFWGQGLAEESSRAIVGFARGLGIRRLLGITSPTNANSIRVLEKLGMGFIEQVVLAGETRQTRVYGMDLNE